jgi:hypothetical protein
MDQYQFARDPIPEPTSVIAGPNYRFTFINDMVLRYEWAHDGKFEDRASTFAINRRFPTPKFEVIDKDDQLVIRSPLVHLSYDKKRFSPNGFLANFYGRTNLWGASWRYGGSQDKNLGGTARTLDGVDGRCDMGLGILSKEGWAALDDSATMLFENNGFVGPRAEGDRVDGYLFFYGLDFKGAMKSFYAISGKQPILPRWTLGNWWSRYHPYTADEYLDLMDKFRNAGVPLSIAVIDMDWHLVHGDNIPHSGWTGYTWNKDLFPDHVDFCDKLHERKLKVTLNDHPHAGIHSHEEAYEEVAAALGHDTSTKAPIDFDPADPKFMYVYLNVLHRRLEKEGCDFWWIDCQQGPYSRIPGLDPLWLLNHFHFLDNGQQTKDGKALIFSRYGGPGSHRYPVGFSGDSIITWESLQFQSEFTATASNIGYGWWSHDIGGHMKGYRDDELTTRWIQLGVFSPLMRLHSSRSKWLSKEPWLFRSEYDAVIRSFLRLRHRMVPYLHSMNERAAEEDEPIVQPLYWQYPGKTEAFEKPNQFYLGSTLVVSPIVHPRNSITNHGGADTWVPPGRHVDIFSGLVYDGDRQLRLYRPLTQLPALAVEGSIIPLDAAEEPENGCENPSAYEVVVVVGKDATFRIREDFEDDAAQTKVGGKVDHRHIELTWKQSEGQLSLASSGKEWSFRFISINDIPDTLKVTANGAQVSGVTSAIEKTSHMPGLVVKIPRASESNAAIVVDLGPNPQLGFVDTSARLQTLLSDYQIHFDTKDKIWNACQTNHPQGVKVSELMRVGLEEDVLGPIIELYTSDSRTT